MIWEMNGTSVVTTAALTNPGASWLVIGAGDFNADGNADILFQNVDSTPMIWEMNGTSIIASASLPNPGNFWNAIGTGDFNGDGMSDILFQNKDGQPMIWEMNGTSIIAQATLSNPGKKWHAIGTEDFNGDGKADILFQNGDGTPLIWQMNGTSVASTFTTANPGSQWVLQDDGPIAQSQMGSGAKTGLHLGDDLLSTGGTPSSGAPAGGGTMHLSAPDIFNVGAGTQGTPPFSLAANDPLLFASSGNALTGVLQPNDQHLQFGRS
jgi:FG-GAP-like repeat